MNLARLMLDELAAEGATTRRLLERVPEEKLSWSPHPRSMTLGQLSAHIAALPAAIADLVDRSPVEVPTVPLPEGRSRQEILATLDGGLALATAAFERWGEEGLHAEWRLVNGSRTLLTMRRLDALRSIMFNHAYHHRGQLTVYLRLLGVSLPPVYGPTADENIFG